MKSEEAELEMARSCNGYGRWDAKYWFIGPEQGQGAHEKDKLEQRVAAWLKLGASELCDCQEFHRLIDDPRWHREKNPRLQSTWGRLILLLMAALGRPIDKECRRQYQRNDWGSAHANGETCVIELSGLAARNFQVRRDRDSFREERTKVIRDRIETFRPEFVVTYGTTQKEYFERIAGGEFPADGVIRGDSTTYVHTPHPTSHGLTNIFWEELGKRLRELATSEP